MSERTKSVVTYAALFLFGMTTFAVVQALGLPEWVAVVVTLAVIVCWMFISTFRTQGDPTGSPSGSPSVRARVVSWWNSPYRGGA